MRQVNIHPPQLWKLDYNYIVRSPCGVSLDSSLLNLLCGVFFFAFFFPIHNGQTFCAGLKTQGSELNSCNDIYLCGVPLPMIFFRKYRYICMQMWLAPFYAFADWNKMCFPWKVWLREEWSLRWKSFTSFCLGGLGQ